MPSNSAFIANPLFHAIAATMHVLLRSFQYYS